jgi:hypothetical protein
MRREILGLLVATFVFIRYLPAPTVVLYVAPDQRIDHPAEFVAVEACDYLERYAREFPRPAPFLIQWLRGDGTWAPDVKHQVTGVVRCLGS